MRFALDEDRLESALKKVTNALMTTIEDLRVEAIEIAHTDRESRLGRFEEEMVVVAHEHVGMYPPGSGSGDTTENPEKKLPIFLVDKDRLLLIPAARDVPKRARMLEPQGTDHLYRSLS